MVRVMRIGLGIRLVVVIAIRSVGRFGIRNRVVVIVVLIRGVIVVFARRLGPLNRDGGRRLGRRFGSRVRRMGAIGRNEASGRTAASEAERQQRAYSRAFKASADPPHLTCDAPRGAIASSRGPRCI